MRHWRLKSKSCRTTHCIDRYGLASSRLRRRSLIVISYSRGELICRRWSRTGVKCWGRCRMSSRIWLLWRIRPNRLTSLNLDREVTICNAWSYWNRLRRFRKSRMLCESSTRRIVCCLTNGLVTSVSKSRLQRTSYVLLGLTSDLQGKDRGLASHKCYSLIRRKVSKKCIIRAVTCCLK